jgi:UDP-N-acetyl-D-galactosamine dehydrogenase
LIFNKMGIDTEAVLKAAGSKWNFLPFRPGLVGGHCIGVDPYYLTYKAESIGYHPEIILAGRRLNDSMGAYVVTQLVKAMTRRLLQVGGARVLIMGLTFKENCPDIRNTLVVDIIEELKDYKIQIDVFDPWAEPAHAQHEYGINLLQSPEPGTYDAIVLAVAHHQFKTMGAKAIRALGKPEHVLYDLKYLLPVDDSDLRL